MSLTAISLFESVRAKLFMNSTHNMCKKIKRFWASYSKTCVHKNLESNVFGLSRPK